jgi:inosose dehydratase
LEETLHTRHLAGAPISWGVCEVPGWGHQLPPRRVLSEMESLGLHATELGPDGYLPLDAGALRDCLGKHHLRLVGGFVPLVLHEPDLSRARERAHRSAELLRAAGADVFVAAILADDDWGAPFELSGWCLDTGHLLIGGTDPVDFVRHNGARIVHVHLKDVDAELAARLRAGELSLVEATQLGLFQPLGQGDARIEEVLRALDQAGYERWLVLEQDTAITGQEPPVGDGPVLDVGRSIEYLTTLAPEREVAER